MTSTAAAAAAGILCVLLSGHAAAALWTGTRNADVMDPQVQMTAYTLEVPAGWRFVGTVARDPGCHANGAGMKFTMQSADGRTALAQLPGSTWSSTTSAQLRRIMETQHCPAIDIDSAASFLVNIAVPNLHPQAKIVAVQPLSTEDRAALAAQLEKARQQNAALARQYGQQPQKLIIDGARVRLQYVRDGQPVEEQVQTVIDCMESQSPAMFGQPASSRRSCSTRGLRITRAPQGHLDDLLTSPQLKDLGKSIQTKPEWSERLARDRQMAFQRTQAQSDRQFQDTLRRGREDHANLMAQNQQFQHEMRDRTDHALAQDRAQQNAIDASAHATAQYSLDRQDFKNPATGQTIEASSQYNHQWLSSDGSTLIQTNDHAYDPNGQVYPVNQSWTELVPK